MLLSSHFHHVAVFQLFIYAPTPVTPDLRWDETTTIAGQLAQNCPHEYLTILYSLSTWHSADHFQHKTVTITITALAVCGSRLARQGIHDCVIESQCFVPSEQHSISSGLFASIFEVDLDGARQFAKTGSRFVRMSWGIGSGPTRFHTTMCLTDDAGAHVRFTHGLEIELRLDVYARNLDQCRAVQPHSGQRQGPAVTTELPPPEHPLEPPWHEAMDGAIVHPAAPDYTTDEERWRVAVNQQILDEVLYREQKNAELQFQLTGNMSGYQALLPPSMDGARSLGPTGSPWVWSLDVRRWYWVDRLGQIWWQPS